MCRLQVFERNSILRFSMEYPPLLVNVLSKSFCAWFCKKDSESRYNIQVEQPRDLARDSGQRKLTYSLQNHCASSRSVYLSRRLDSHWDKFAGTHHLKEVGVFSTEIKNSVLYIIPVYNEKIKNWLCKITGFSWQFIIFFWFFWKNAFWFADTFEKNERKHNYFMKNVWQK